MADCKQKPRSQGLLRFQGDRHLESGVDPGNEVEQKPGNIFVSVTGVFF